LTNHRRDIGLEESISYNKGGKTYPH
jgi:hypothetical protein